MQEQLFPVVGVANFSGFGVPAIASDGATPFIRSLANRPRYMDATRSSTAPMSDLRSDAVSGWQPSGSYSFGLGQTQGPNPLVAAVGAGERLSFIAHRFRNGSYQQCSGACHPEYVLCAFVNDDIKMGRLTLNWDCAGTMNSLAPSATTALGPSTSIDVFLPTCLATPTFAV